MEIFKIVLEGPPHSGKSSVLKRLKAKAAEKNTVPIAFSEEIATEILREDPTFPMRDKNAFQKEVLTRQKAREEHLSHILNQTETASPFAIQILDRGAADLYVYLDHQTADSINQADLTSLLSRYTLVIHFDLYHPTEIRSGNQNRIESDPGELRALSEKSKAVWGKHKRFLSVPPTRTIDEKTAAVANIINHFFGADIF